MAAVLAGCAGGAMIWIVVGIGVVIGLSIAWWTVAFGPLSDRAEYETAARELRAGFVPAGVVSDADLAGLPKPAARLLRAWGAVGRPCPTLFEATWRGRIRTGAGRPWMTLKALQTNHTRTPARYFWLSATMSGVPVRGLHVFANGAASMLVKLLGLFPVARADGPRATRAEMVTLLNDLALLVPSALLQPAVEFTAIDDRSFGLAYTLSGVTVTAVCTVDREGNLLDFVSTDRARLMPDGRFQTMRWSTPVWNHERIGGVTVPTAGEARWHPEDGPPEPYIELQLEALTIDDAVTAR